MTFIYFLELFGTFVFAISGILTATSKKFDLVGAIIIGIVTSMGGGTLRDLLIGSTPVGWMLDLNYIYVVGAALFICFFFSKYFKHLRKSFFLFDTIGIALFTVLGMQKTLDAGLSPTMAIMMGIVSAVFGGVIRDVLTNRIPLIFRKEIYATACLAGALTYYLMLQFSQFDNFNLAVSMLVVMAIRIVSVKKSISLPFQPKI